jgi:excisionase family DNA binding protein
MEKTSIEIDKKLALNVEEAAALIGVRRSHLYGLLKMGRIKARKSGTRTLILRADLETYLASTPEMKTQTGAP